MALPLLDIKPHYDRYCAYPTSLKVAMDDKTVQTYVLQNKTDYQFDKVMECLERMDIGYPKQTEPKKKNRRNR